MMAVVMVVNGDDSNDIVMMLGSSENDDGDEMMEMMKMTVKLMIIMIMVIYHCSHIVLTSSNMIILRELSDREGWGKVKHRYALDYILKITAKKKNPEIITFRFGTGIGEEAVITDQLRLRIPNTTKVTTAVKEQIMNYQDKK